MIFDPFMGSGTTVGEALKVGARAIGRDINPVSYFAVRNALGIHPQVKIFSIFRDLERDTAPDIRQWYRSRLPDGSEVQTLYYFWVKVLSCPSCGNPVDLFSRYIFSQNAYAKRVPEARAICPHCYCINQIRYDADSASCVVCEKPFNPQIGPARHQRAICSCCKTKFSIAERAREIGHPPRHRRYAKMVLHSDGGKEYLATSRRKNEALSFLFLSGT